MTGAHICEGFARARRCVIRCLVHKRFLIAGGAAPEVEVATQLSRWAKTLVVRARLAKPPPYTSCPLAAADTPLRGMHSCSQATGARAWPTAPSLVCAMETCMRSRQEDVPGIVRRGAQCIPA